MGSPWNWVSAHGVKNSGGATRPNKKFDYIFSRLDRIQERDGRTDTGRQQRPRLRIPSRGKSQSTVKLLSTTTLRFTGYFPGGRGLASTRMSSFWILLELRVMEVVVTTGVIRCAKLQSNCHHQQTRPRVIIITI